MPPSWGRMPRAGMVAACAAVFLASGLAVSPALAKGACDSNRDFAHAQKCFLLQFPCIDAYFGIGGPPDYPRALSCFEASKQWPFVSMMYFNGEGAPRDLDKAEAILKSVRKTDPDAFVYGPAAALQKAIDKCKSDPLHGCARIDYCRTLETTTLDDEVCYAVDQLSEEAALTRQLAAIRSKLTIANRATFDRAVAEYMAYQLDEAQRTDDGSVPGTIAGLAAASQAATVRGDFRKLLAETIQQRKLKSASLAEYQAADNELAWFYPDDIRRFLEDSRELPGEVGDENAREIVADYKKTARQSQHRWFRLRDLMAKLADSLYAGRTNGFDPALSMKTALTKIRIDELRDNPIGPVPESNLPAASPFAPAIGQGVCANRKDFAAVEKCFLAQFPCVAIYATGFQADRPKALKCFAAHKRWPWVVSMYFDGVGDEHPNRRKAEALLIATRKSDPTAYDDDQAATLQKIIDDCKRDPRSCGSADYCENLVGTATDRDLCGAIDRLWREEQLTQAAARIRGGLNSAERAVFERMIAAFKDYQLAEMYRARDSSAYPPRRGMIGAAQAELVRDNFLTLMTGAVQARNLKPAGAREFKAANAELDRVYAGDIRDYDASWEEFLADPELKPWQSRYQSLIEDYKNRADESQRRWIKFRDLAAELASLLYRDRAKSFGPALSMETAMTKMRIAEIRMKAVGP
ncbi:MAG: hypothetical protein ACREQI_08860 [Candidatus Binataceae bacterium]